MLVAARVVQGLGRHPSPVRLRPGATSCATPGACDPWVHPEVGVARVAQVLRLAVADVVVLAELAVAAAPEVGLGQAQLLQVEEAAVAYETQQVR